MHPFVPFVIKKSHIIILIFMKNDTWCMPEYCKNFRCKADSCRNTCCSSWKIPISRKEYEKLMNMECSDRLYRRVQRSFEEPELVSEDRYRYVSFNWLGQCPLQEKGLCTIHKEKGEDFLPKICRLYPRSLRMLNQYHFLSCSSSCEAVLEYLFDHDEMNIIRENYDGKAEITIQIEDEEIVQSSQIQKAFKDRTTSLSESIADVCILINRKEFISDFLSETDPLDSALLLMERFSDANERLKQIIGPIILMYRSNRSQYETDAVSFETDYPDWMYFFERVINNSLLYENFPFTDSRIDKTDSYKGLCACYGLMRVICIGDHRIHKEKDDLIDALSALFHLIDHTAFFYNVSVLSEHPAVMLKL